MIDKETDEFCKNHNIKITESKYRRQYYRPPFIPTYFTDPTDYNKIHSIETFDEPMYVLEILKSELDRIISFEKHVYDNVTLRGGYGQMFEIMLGQKHQESELRKRYPAVQKAYEQYSMMLKLAQSGEV